MLRIRERPYDEIRELLASDELSALNAALSERLRTPIARDLNTTVMLQSVMNDVCYTGLSTPEFRAMLAIDKGLIVALFAISSKAEDLGEEYPAGEEPTEDEKPEVIEELGLSRTAGVHAATLLHFVRDRSQADLMSYLEMSRTPHRAKYAKQLRAAYQEAAAAALE
jgi:hypothetical protein